MVCSKNPEIGRLRWLVDLGGRVGGQLETEKHVFLQASTAPLFFLVLETQVQAVDLGHRILHFKKADRST